MKLASIMAAKNIMAQRQQSAHAAKCNIIKHQNKIIAAKMANSEKSRRIETTYIEKRISIMAK